MKVKCYQVDVFHEGVEAPFVEMEQAADTRIEGVFPPEFFLVGSMMTKTEAYLVHLPPHLRADLASGPFPDTFVAVVER